LRPAQSPTVTVTANEATIIAKSMRLSANSIRSRARILSELANQVVVVYNFREPTSILANGPTVKPTRIALLISQDLSFSRNVIRGVREYALGKPGWVFRNGPAGSEAMPLLRDWRPHGIIAGLYSKEFARRVARLRRPLVDTACAVEGLDVPVVDVDHAAVGRMAAEYFLNLGFEHFGYFGVEGAVNSRLREDSFRQRLAEAGRTVARVTRTT
jgi:DNA-binding LacI/PurR family transcriptional regulator